jgi:2-polyprenyl-6-hydroxyphenyl methylase/3-demethylubiquinone-9 3-methyltransferase
MQSAPSGAAEAIAYHDTLASGWTQRYESGGFKRRAEFFAQDVLPKAKIAGDWIDVGCGSGFFSRILAHAGARVLGVDGSAAMIAAAKAFPGAGPAPCYEVRTVEDLAEGTGRYDGALFLSVMEYLDDPAASLDAVARWLRPGGTLILSAPNRNSGLRRTQGALRAVAAKFGSKAFPYLASSRNAWSRRELAALAAGQGLACEVILGFDPVAPRPLWPIVSPSLWFAVCVKRS